MDIDNYKDEFECISAGGESLSAPKDENTGLRRYIKVIGVGGAGGSAVNRLAETGIEGVQLVACNTDLQDLSANKAEVKIQLGERLTEGLGAGNDPSVGTDAAIEAMGKIEELLSDSTKMVFITAGMGGGTGTGAAPVIAKVAKEKDILTIGIVSLPFSVEGPQRIQQANEGIKKMREVVDALLVINVDKLNENIDFMSLSVDENFRLAEEVIVAATKGIAEIITRKGLVNVDFRDVNGILKRSGVALFGSSIAEGNDRSMNAVKQALSSPLLHDNDIKNAKHTIVNITTSSNKKLTMGELKDILDHIRYCTGSKNNLIYGCCYDDAVQEAIRVTIIVTGFEYDDEPIALPPEVTTISLGDELPEMEVNLNEDEIRPQHDFTNFKDLDKLSDDEFLRRIEEETAIDRKNKNK